MCLPERRYRSDCVALFVNRFEYHLDLCVKLLRTHMIGIDLIDGITRDELWKRDGTYDLDRWDDFVMELGPG